MNIVAKYKSNITSLEDREVYKINNEESLIELEGYYYIRSTDEKSTGKHYRGIYDRYENHIVLDLVRKGM